MKRRTKTFGIVLLILVVAAVAAVLAFAQAQNSTQPTTTASTPTTFLGKVAANLGITEDALVAAYEKASIQTIDEAVAAGRITAEQASQMKERIGANETLQKLIAQGLASGQLTQEQADLLNQRFPGGRTMGMSARGRAWSRGMSWGMRGWGGCR